MKHIKKLIAMILAVTMLASLLPMSVMAATTSLTVTSTAKTQKISSTTTWYKISCPGEGYVTISVPSSPYGDIGVYNAQKRAVAYVYSGETRKIAVSKGYIYVKADYISNSYIKFSYKFNAITQKSNYCKAKAYSLAKDKKVSFYQTPNYTFPRWIKISVKTVQSIKIYHNFSGNCSVYLYDSKMQPVSLNYNTNSIKNYDCYNSPVVGKGTFYLLLYPNFEMPQSVETIYWK